MVGDRGLRTVERDGSFARADSVEFGFWISVEGGKPTKPKGGKGGTESALVLLRFRENWMMNSNPCLKIIYF
jgi:hypothetical protein